VREAVGEDRAADRHPEAAADRAEEGRSCRGDAEVAVVDVVLDGEHEHLHHEAEPEADDEHVERAGRRGRRWGHPRQQQEPDDEQRRAGDRERLVVPPARDDLAAPDRGREKAQYERQQLQARRGRRGAVDDLQEERQVGRRPEERQPDDEAHRAGDREDAAGEQAQRQHRLGRATFNGDQRRGGDHREDAEADDLPRAPRVGRPAEARREHERAGREAEQDRPPDVDARLAALGRHA
jgi:hypothetical protein